MDTLRRTAAISLTDRQWQALMVHVESNMHFVEAANVGDAAFTRKQISDMRRDVDEIIGEIEEATGLRAT